MSKDTNKLAKNNGISVEDKKKLSSFDGWLTKQGGSVKSWKRRYFLLVSSPNKNDEAELYYFKTDKAKDATGVIKITAKSTVSLQPVKGKKEPCVAISNSNNTRTFFIHGKDATDNQKFEKALNDKINAMKKPGVTIQTEEKKDRAQPPPAGASVAVGAITNGAGAANHEVSDDDELEGIRAQLDTAKNSIPFLSAESEQDRILEFWQIWSESIPAQKDTEVYAVIVATPDMSQLSWRVFGPQHALIQEMVDFFWNVGAPETEIDRLNNIGSIINPLVIGSWIDMSTKGGMDGGWVFPVEVVMTDALQACDEGAPLVSLRDWTSKHKITNCITVGRDMGASPPRQTEIRFFLPGSTFESQWEIAMSAFQEFNFPAPKSEYCSIIQSWGPMGMIMSVITSSEGFVRIGLLIPKPDKNVMMRLCEVSGNNPETLVLFQNKMNIPKPEFVEFQHLMESFGYGVYNEGFNLVFHYQLLSQ